MIITLLLTSLSFASTPSLKGFCPFDYDVAKKTLSPSLQEEMGAEIKAAFEHREHWYGACERIEDENSDEPILHYPNGQQTLQISRSGDKITECAFLDFKVKNDSWKKLTQNLKDTWPNSSLYVEEGGQSLLHFNSEENLAIAESANLFLLNAVRKAINGERMSAQTKIKLDKNKIADPLDELAEKQNGLSLSVKELQKFMVVDLDRTAADMLLGAVGREAVENETTSLKPFLTRREAAWLWTLSPEEVKKINKNSLIEKAHSLDKPGAPPLPVERYDVQNSVSWWASTKDLCAVAQQLKDSEVLRSTLASKNFLADHGKKKFGFYFSRRDFGVAQATWITASKKAGPWKCVSLTVNHAAQLNEDHLEEIVQRIDFINE